MNAADKQYIERIKVSVALLRKDLDAIGGEYSEITLTPKASSSGAEGTIYYDSDDDHVYVATE